jgi:sugar O-acyltransferase (sialic acid O-acetyltransferase NeuD family)
MFRKIDRYVLWGSAGHAKVLADIINLTGGRVVALFDNNPSACSSISGVPLFIGSQGFKIWLDGQKSLEGIGAAIAIGGTRGKVRKELALELRYFGFTFPTLIHPSAVVSKSASFGEGCQILANAVVSADVTMDSFCIVNNGANVDHECSLSSGVHIAPGAVLCGCVTIAENSFVGAGSVVLPRVHIGSGSVIGAGSVVTCDVLDNVVVFGNPAVIKNIID